MSKSNTYYNNNYFSDQKEVAIFNAQHLKKIFQPFIKKEEEILDFGCGGGYLLDALECDEKHGFDVNNSALERARKFDVITHNSFATLENESFDVIVSNSALEHTPNPDDCIKELYKKLKNDGKIIFRIPHETLGWKYKPNDWNYHLYTWSPMALGNLFNDCGYKNINVKIEKTITPPFQKYYRSITPINYLIVKGYRIFRLILEELNIHSIHVDGYSIISAEK